MEINENIIDAYKSDIKTLIELLDIVELTIKEDDENRIDESLVSDDELETKLNELLYTLIPAMRLACPTVDG